MPSQVNQGKVRDLKSVCHVAFESHVHYACIIWGHNAYTINRFFILQKKALTLIYFKERNTYTQPLFLKPKTSSQN